MANTLKIKRGAAATIPNGALAEPLFTSDTYDLYIGKGDGTNQRFQKYIASGTSSQFLKGDGSLDSNTYQTALTFTSPLVNTSGTISIPAATSSVNGYLTSTDWTTFNSKEPAITAGTTLQYYRGDKTFQTLDTAAVPENGAIYFTEPRVRATVLTGLNLSGGGTISASDSILTAFGKVQNQISALVGGATYQGTWNASTNTPTLASGTGTKGYYYVVSVAGSTNLDGITDWKVGDWAIFNGTTWDKVDNTDAVSSVNGFTGAVNLGLDNISDVSAASPTNAQFLRFNGTNSLWENYTLTSGDIPSGSNNYIQNNATATAQNAKFYIGTGNRIDNSTNTDGIYLANSGIGNGYRVANSSTGSGIVIDNSSGGTGLLVGNTSTGSGIVVDNSTAATGYLFRGAKNAVNKILMDDSGNITAASYIKSGGTSSQFLKADGSIDTNTYLTTSSAASTYLPLAGGTLTGALGGTSATFSASVTTPAGFYIDSNTYLYEGILRLTDLVGKKNILQLQASSSGHYITSLFLTGGSQQAIYISAKSTAGQNVIFNTDGTTTFSHGISGTSATFSGDVAIGLATASRRLHVKSGVGTAQIESTGASSTLYFGDTGSTSIDNQGIGSNGNSMYIMTGGTNRLTIASTGAATFSSSVTAINAVLSGTGSLFGDGLRINRNGIPTQHTIINHVGGASNFISVDASGNNIPEIYFQRSINGTTVSNSMMINKDGNVGINTTAPSYKLHVSNAADSAIARFTGGTSANINVGIFATNEYGFASIGTQSNHEFHIYTNDTDRITIKTNGNVGIGIDNPQSQFHMNGTLTFSEPSYNTVRLHTISHIHSSSTDANNAIIFNVSNAAGTTSERMRINGAGNVEVTTTTFAQVKINNAATTGSNRGTSFEVNSTTNAGTTFLGQLNAISNNANAPYSSTDGIYLMSRTSGFPLIFTTNNGGTEAERMRITSGGAVQATNNLTANSPSAGNTGEGIIAGTSFKIDATGTGQSAKMYVVTKTLSDTYGSAFQIQFANSDDNKGFGYNINTSGGYETYVKDSGANWQRRMVIAQGGDVEIINNLTANSYVSKKGTQSTANTTWTTVYTIPQTTAAQGIYYVYAHYLDGVDGMAFIQILADRTYRRSINGSNGATVSVRLDGNNIQVYQSYGVTLNIDWSILIQKLL